MASRLSISSSAEDDTPNDSSGSLDVVETPKGQYTIALPRQVESGQYIGMFGLKKHAHAGNANSFSIRVDYSEQEPKLDEQHYIDLTLKSIIDEVEDGIPLSVTLDEHSGDWIVHFVTPMEGLIQVGVSFRTRTLKPPPKEEDLVEMVNLSFGRKKSKETRKPKFSAAPPRIRRSSNPRKSFLPILKKMDLGEPKADTPKKGQKVQEDDKYKTKVIPLFGGPQTMDIVQAVAQSLCPQGGELVVGNHTLTIPPGALDEEVHVHAYTKVWNTQIVLKRGFNSVHVRSQILVLEPTGLKFKKEVTLTMNYACNARWPKASMGRLVWIYWPNENKVWQDLRQGSFSRGTATRQISEFGNYAIGTMVNTDASYLPVALNCTSLKEMIAEAVLCYSRLLGKKEQPNFLGGHSVLVRWSLTKDKSKEQKNLHPIASIGIFLENERTDSLAHFVHAKTIEILSFVTDENEKTVILRILNRTSQPIACHLDRGFILEPRQNPEYQHPVLASGIDIKLKGLQEATYSLPVFDTMEALKPLPIDEPLNLTPFTMDRAFLNNQNKVFGYFVQKLEK